MSALLIKSFPAAAAVTAFRFVKFAAPAVDRSVAQANAATSPLVGVSDSMGAPQGGMADVIQVGLAELRLGGTVSAGDFLTADADGKGIKCVPAAGETRVYGAIAQAPGVADDIIPVLVGIGVITPA
ncbi:DUF2190 family protein [Rhodoplanes sp. TEM]|uniref:DUF2190 family protein n=1 Tax=Rhodoplanes tepidamans TaxID=200616 RepID=A0ABT5JDL7_RHOTP|nr:MULTISPECIES: capsid cement protein [Rhodoplanes]MDC7787354.1 DUF2190 family protein [Rhodoplanes tepidamans]MDC7984764.1 DUF2190 family protein [Rhodoplanes sp. TEM]MDQ0358265.1 hypothetical protein [Rhodoplanes tepidamans]